MRLTTWSGDDTTASAVASPVALASARMSGSVIMRRIAADSFLMCRARRAHFFWTTRFFWLGYFQRTTRADLSGWGEEKMGGGEFG